MTASEDGMSDYNSVDVIREAQATVVAAAQSSTLLHPAARPGKARVLTLNLRNRMIFKAADEEGAVESADFLGKEKFIKRSWGFSMGSDEQLQRAGRAQDQALRPSQSPKHSCVLVHCERGFTTRFRRSSRMGRVCSWFRRS